MSRDVGSAATWLTILFLAQAAGALVFAAQRDPAAAAAIRHAGVASALFAIVGLFARSRVRGEPAAAAGILAGLLAVEVAGLVALVGIPPVPVLLQVSIVLLYSALGVLTLSAVCAALTLRMPAPARTRALRKPARCANLDHAA